MNVLTASPVFEKRSLAVYSPYLGIPSETFIRRYVNELEPGGAAVFSLSDQPPKAGWWSAEGPTLVLSRARRPLLSRHRWADFGRPEAEKGRSAVKEFLRRTDAKVVFSQYLDWSLRWLPLFMEMGIPVWVHAHGYDVSRSLRDPAMVERYQRELFGKGGIITMSAYSRERLLELGCPEEGVQVIPYGVAVAEECPEQTVPTEEVRCVAVGRMVGKKAPILLLEAFRRAWEREPRLRLDFLGGGPQWNAAHQWVEAMGMEEVVTLHGTCESAQVQEAMSRAHLFLQHSRIDPETGDEEGLPVAILEAMALALPVISTRHAGIPEAVAQGETGLLVEEGDVDGMAQAIVELGSNPPLALRMGRAGWQGVRESFSWEREKTALRELLGLHEA